MSANIVTLIRMVLAIITLILFQQGFALCAAALLLMIMVFYMDSLDGYLARKFKVASDFGALFDITADRIVEHVYWIFFAALGMVSFWVPIIFVSRSFLVDTVRGLAYSREGKTPFGEKTLMRSSFTRYLTAGRFMRALYGVLKLSSFFLLGGLLMIRAGSSILSRHLSPSTLSGLILFTQVCIWITTAVCLIRGLPVLWDGRIYLFERYFPRDIKDAG